MTANVKQLSIDSMIDAAASQPAAKPASKPAAKPASKPAAKPASKPAAKPASKSAIKRATTRAYLAQLGGDFDVTDKLVKQVAPFVVALDSHIPTQDELDNHHLAYVAKGYPIPYGSNSRNATILEAISMRLDGIVTDIRVYERVCHGMPTGRLIIEATIPENGERVTRTKSATQELEAKAAAKVRAKSRKAAK